MAAPKGNQYAKGNPNSGRPPKWTEPVLEEEAEALLEYARKPDSITLVDYWPTRGFSDVEACRFEKSSEVFSKAKRMAKNLIGGRREKMGLLGDYDSAIVRSSMATYDYEHRMMLKEMKREELLEEAKQIVIRERGSMDVGKDNKVS